MTAECAALWQIVIGAVSAFATIALGVIAIWQNKRYKELSDEMNDRTVMPQFYQKRAADVIYASFEEADKEYELSVIPSCKNTTCYSIFFSTLDNAIVNLQPVRFTAGNSEYDEFLNVQDFSIYKAGQQFCITIFVPDIMLPSESGKKTACNLKLSFCNIYGDAYCTQVSFDLEYGHFDKATDIEAINIRMERPKRYYNGQA